MQFYVQKSDKQTHVQTVMRTVRDFNPEIDIASRSIALYCEVGNSSSKLTVCLRAPRTLAATAATSAEF